MLDLHSHILFSVDDGAQDLQTSLELLRSLYQQGVTHVIATPHFYAMEMDMQSYMKKVYSSFRELSKHLVPDEMPAVTLGSEVFYFSGIGKSTGIKNLTLCGSKYILLELPSCRLDRGIFQDIKQLSEQLDLIPIFAHVERYSHQRGYRELLKLIKNGYAYAQVNTDSVIDVHEKRLMKKLIGGGYVSFLGTDTHSPEKRPPKMEEALRQIETWFGASAKRRLVSNGEKLCHEIWQLPNVANG